MAYNRKYLSLQLVSRSTVYPSLAQYTHHYL